MEMKEQPDGNGQVQFISYCPKHCRPRPELSGATRRGGRGVRRREGEVRGTGNFLIAVQVSGCVAVLQE